MTPQADGTILRGACLAMARSLNRHVKPGSSWDQKARNGDPRPGDLFNEQADWADILAPAGWSLVKTDGQVCYWLRPGKTDHEWSASTGYLRDGSVPLLYVFSSSAAPFEPERSYTPFAAFTLLNHGGDYKAAARALAGQGYTARPAPAVNGNGHSNGSTPAQPRQEPPDEVFPDAVPWPGPISPLAYHGLAGQIVRAMEAETESDPVAILIQILVIFGNAIGRHAYWQVEGDKHYGNLFCCLVGETAKGRKGTSKGRAMQAFTAVEDDSWRGRFASGLSSGEGLIWAVRDPIYKRHQVKKDGRVIDHQDIEEDPGAPDKRLLVIESEFVGALRSAGRDGNTLSARIREAWDTGNLLSLTKNSQAKATGAHISIIGHITKAELSRAMSEVETTNGFANRFLWCAVRRSQMLPMGGKYVELGHLDDQIALLITHAQLAGEVPFDAGAEDLWCRELYPKLTAPAHGIAASVCNRAEAQVRRLALLYSLLDGTTRTVRQEHLLAALAVWDYCEQSVRWIFGDSTGDPIADQLLDALRAAGDKGLTQTQIRDLFGRNESKTRLVQALAMLEEGRQARRERALTGGRPTTKWIFTYDKNDQSKKDCAARTYGDKPQTNNTTKG